MIQFWKDDLNNNKLFPLDNGNTVHAQGIGVILRFFPNCSIIQWEKFIIVQVILPKPYHQVPSNFMLDFKSLCMNLLKIVILLTIRVVLGNRPKIIKTIFTIFKLILSKSTLKETGIFFPTVCSLSKQNISHLICQSFDHVSIARLKLTAIKGLIEVSQKISLTWNNPTIFVS